jgi:hypothetical protein
VEVENKEKRKNIFTGYQQDDNREGKSEREAKVEKKLRNP